MINQKSPEFAKFVARRSELENIKKVNAVRVNAHKRQVDINVSTIKEMEFRLGDAADKQGEYRKDYRRAGHRQNVKYAVSSHHLSLFLKLTPFLLILR